MRMMQATHLSRLGERVEEWEACLHVLIYEALVCFQLAPALALNLPRIEFKPQDSGVVDNTARPLQADVGTSHSIFP